MKLFKNAFNLRLFDEGTSAGDGNAQGVESSPNSQTAAGQQTQNNAEPNAKTVDKDAEFKKLIKGEYKDIYNGLVKKAIDERFKNNKVNEDRLSKAETILSRVAQMSGNDDTKDLDALLNRLDEIDPNLENEAVQRGMSVETLREIKKLERANKQYQEAENQRQADIKAYNQMQEWNNQAKELAGIYGDKFNLENELKNEDFRGLLEYGYPMQKAFEVVHLDELMSNAMQYASSTTSKNISANIQAQGSRPTENGLKGNAPVNSTVDFSQISSDDWNKITDLVVQGKVKNASEALRLIRK